MKHPDGPGIGDSSPPRTTAQNDTASPPPVVLNEVREVKHPDGPGIGDSSPPQTTAQNDTALPSPVMLNEVREVKHPDGPGIGDSSPPRTTAQNDRGWMGWLARLQTVPMPVWGVVAVVVLLLAWAAYSGLGTDNPQTTPTREVAKNGTPTSPSLPSITPTITAVATHLVDVLAPITTSTYSVTPNNTPASPSITLEPTTTPSPTSTLSTVMLDSRRFATQNVTLLTEIEANVAEIRGLEPLQPITLTFLTREELAQQVQADFAEEADPEESQQDTLVLAAFDFVERDFDLYQTYVDLYSEQILGHYHLETAEFVVVVSNDFEMDATEQWTYAHEFMHALQDQHSQLELIADETLDSEASAALRALAEGEAELIQGLYLYGGYFSADEQAEILASFEQATDSSLDAIPPILLSNLSFPYNEGFEFVLTLFTEGGGTFELIDQAWQNLPTSTEQIIHPDRYFAGDNPIPVSLPPLTATLGADWQRLDEDVFGEFFLREYLAQQLSLSDAETAAEGWGGDRYAVYGNENGEVVMVLRLVWDTTQDSQQFAAAYPEYPASLFNTTSTTQPNGGQCWQGELDVICFYQNEDESLIVRAPTVEIAAQVAESIR